MWCAMAAVFPLWQSVYSMQYNNNASWKSTQIWDLRMEDILNLKRKNLYSWKCTFCAKKTSYAGCPGLSPAIPAQLILKM